MLEMIILRESNVLSPSSESESKIFFGFVLDFEDCFVLGAGESDLEAVPGFRFDEK